MLRTICLLFASLPATAAEKDLPSDRSTIVTEMGNGVIQIPMDGKRISLAPVDKVTVPERFRGAWAEAIEGCDATTVPTSADERTEGKKLVVLETQLIDSNGRLAVVGTYVQAKGRMTHTRIAGRKPVTVPYRKLTRDSQITLKVVGMIDGATNYLTFRKHNESMMIEYSENGRAFVPLVRCFLAVPEAVGASSADQLGFS
jgi:hypothetical protein